MNLFLARGSGRSGARPVLREGRMFYLSGKVKTAKPKFPSRRIVYFHLIKYARILSLASILLKLGRISPKSSKPALLAGADSNSGAGFKYRQLLLFKERERTLGAVSVRNCGSGMSV